MFYLRNKLVVISMLLMSVLIFAACSEETVVETKSKSGKIVLFGSKVPNKNFNFMVKVLKQISKKQFSQNNFFSQ